MMNGMSSAATGHPRRTAAKMFELGLYLAVCLVTRAGLWGDWNYEVDDQFYALVGQRLLHGASLYADIWDRKGPFLYFTYALLGLISGSVLAYQLAATACVIWGAYGIARLAEQLSTVTAGIIAGLSYCLLVLLFGGANGQSEVFFEPLIITAALSLTVRAPQLAQGQLSARLIGGFTCAGIAIAFKQSAAIEAVFLGMVALWLQVRSGVGLALVVRNTGVLALAGILPMAICAGWFWLGGHFSTFWQALVESNMHRAYMPPAERLRRLPIVLAEMAVPLIFACAGWLTLRKNADRLALNIVTGWCLVALAAVASFPNVINHYLLTTLPPLCVLASGLYGRGRIGQVALAGVALSVLPGNHALRWSEREQSRRASGELVAYIRSETPDHRLLVWGWPSYLYVLTDSPPPTVLAFPPHLFDASEANSSGRDPVEEVRRILRGGPSTVVVQDPLPAAPLNQASVDLVNRYVQGCLRQRSFQTFDQFGSQTQKVFSHCRNPAV